MPRGAVDGVSLRYDPAVPSRPLVNCSEHLGCV